MDMAIGYFILLLYNAAFSLYFEYISMGIPIRLCAFFAALCFYLFISLNLPLLFVTSPEIKLKMRAQITTIFFALLFTFFYVKINKLNDPKKKMGK